MTGDTMKSDCTMDSRYRSEGRPSLPRRRVATKTSHENGDFEMELSLAIKESLKYAKEKEGQLKRVDKTSPLLNGVKSDESFSRMAGKMLSLATSSDQGQGSEEVQQLKDLLLIHIELIQHQQELLANKEKDIRLLRHEKDTLQCRLQKAEKRLTLLKQREDLLEAQIASSKGVAAAVEVASVPAPPERNKVVPKAEPTPPRKRRKRQKGAPRKWFKVKKHKVDADKASESMTSDEQEDFDAEESESAEEDDDVEEEDDRENEETSETEGEEESVRGGREREDSTDKKSAETDEVDENKDPYPEPVLRTDCLYYVSCCVELPPEEPMEVPEEDVVSGEEVETPGWRINVLTNRYQLEGTENITDEAYQKRHQKHEVEERRRKRWDIQRMREQRVFEKLRGKEEAAASLAQNDQSLKSFLPTVDDLTHIEISESVPVMVFGHAVPHVEPSEFELPWDTGPSSSFTRKSHGGRGRQK